MVSRVDEALRAVGEFRPQMILEQPAPVPVVVGPLLGEFAGGDGRHEGYA